MAQGSLHNLEAVCEVLSWGLSDVDVGSGVVEADIVARNGKILLVVTHELASPEEIENQEYKRLFRSRVDRAMLVNQEGRPWRRLMVRARDAKLAKPRRRRDAAQN